MVRPQVFKDCLRGHARISYFQKLLLVPLSFQTNLDNEQVVPVCLGDAFYKIPWKALRLAVQSCKYLGELVSGPRAPGGAGPGWRADASARAGRRRARPGAGAAGSARPEGASGGASEQTWWLGLD